MEKMLDFLLEREYIGYGTVVAFSEEELKQESLPGTQKFKKICQGKKKSETDKKLIVWQGNNTLFGMAFQHKAKEVLE